MYKRCSFLKKNVNEKSKCLHPSLTKPKICNTCKCSFCKKDYEANVHAYN